MSAEHEDNAVEPTEAEIKAQRLEAMLAEKQERQCTAKLRYDTETAARAQAAFMRYMKGEDLRAYGPCRFCFGWHVGHHERYKELWEIAEWYVTDSYNEMLISAFTRQEALRAFGAEFGRVLAGAPRAAVYDPAKHGDDWVDAEDAAEQLADAAIKAMGSKI